MMKRMRSYGEDLGSAAGEKELDRSMSAAGMISSSSSSHQRRWKVVDSGRGRPGAVDDDRDREVFRGGFRKRFDHDVDGFDDREGSRGFRKRSDHEFGNGFGDREVWRNVRKRIDHDLDGFDEREGGRGLRKRIDHDFDGFDDREGPRGFRKRLEHDPDGFERRKGFDRYRDRDGIDRGGVGSPLVSPRGGYVSGERERERDRFRDRERDRIHRSESFSVSRGDFPKGFRSGRDRSKREGSVSSWRRFGNGGRSKEVEDDTKTSAGNSSKGGGPVDGGSSSRDSIRSPQVSKDVKSPALSKESKDSAGPLKEVKIIEKKVAENGKSGGSASEIEEGELHPDVLKESGCRSSSLKEVKDVAETGKTVQVDSTKEAPVEVNTEKQSESEAVQNLKSDVNDSANEVKLVNKEMVDDTNDPAVEVIQQPTVLESSKDEISAQVMLSASECNQSNRSSGDYERRDSEAVNDGHAAAVSEHVMDDPPEQLAPVSNEHDCKAMEEVNDNTVSGVLEDKMENAVDLEVVAEDVIVPEHIKDVTEDNQHESESPRLTEKDKGKAVAFCSSDDAGKGPLVEQNFISLRNDSSEGPSIRGFELFSCSGSVKAEKGDKTSLTKGETEKLELEPLDLSLGLPNVSVPVPSCSVAPPPSSPPRARSVQSLATTLRTGSDGFTTSISFSGSQFMHNPSCSLTHNSVDYDCEQSVKSRPLFQGIDWQALAMNDSLPKELPYQKVSSTPNGSAHLSNSSHAIFSSQPVRAPVAVLDKSGSFQRQLSGIRIRNPDDAVSPAQSAGSQGTRSDYLKESRRAIGEGSGTRLFRSASHNNMEQAASRESDFIHSIVGLVVSEPVQAMAWKFPEMADESITYLKEGIREIVLKRDVNQRLRSLQGVLNNRSDLTLEVLLKCHRVQLEILVAIKTGVVDFLWHGDSISSIDLAEIFLNLKCRNPNCGSALPVDDCECKFCSRKDGFCSMCMCLICSNFDTASNTCSWIGCDLCSHWCHADCGLQKGYIRNGPSVSSGQGTSEMHLYCVACDHPSEMFGFVKDVFKTCAAEWKKETMVKELEYVKRIFATSSDPRGQVLHGFASQLLVRFELGCHLQEYQKQLMGFFEGCDTKFGNASASSGQELPNNKATTPRTTAPLRNSAPAAPDAEGSSAGNRRKKTPASLPVVDELESLVKLKQAEAKMFQSRADDARRDADGLQRMVAAKSAKIDEEYAAHLAALRLPQVEEARRRKREELQALERSHRDYVNMKTRMQDDVKKLLLRMEDAKRNFVA